MSRNHVRPWLGISLALATLSAAPAQAQQYDADCKPLPPGEEQLDREIAKAWLPIGLGFAIADKVCAGKNYLNKLFADEPDPDKITPTEVFDAVRPDVPPAISTQEHYRLENEAAERLKARAEAEKRAYLNSNPADEAVRESEERDRALRADGQVPQYGPNPAPVTEPGYVAAPPYTTLPPLNPDGFITVFQATAPQSGDGTPPASLDQIDGEGTLLSTDGLQSGQFVDGQLNGEGQEITADGKWRGGTYVDGGLEGPGFEVYEQDGQVLAVEAEYLDDTPDGQARVLLADGSTRIDLWRGGQRIAIGTVVPSGREPLPPIYKSPEQLAAEEQEKFEQSLDAAAGPATLYALADQLNEQGDSARARQAWRKILTRFPESPFALRASDRLDGASRLAGPAAPPPAPARGTSAPAPTGAATSPAAAIKSGEWVGESSGNRVTLDVRWGGVMVTPVSQNAGQGANALMYQNGPNGTFRFAFPDGSASVMQVLSADRIRVTNPDGWTDVFRLSRAAASSATTAAPPPATPPASGCIGSTDYCWAIQHGCTPGVCMAPPGWTGSSLMLPRREALEGYRAAFDATEKG